MVRVVSTRRDAVVVFSTDEFVMDLDAEVEIVSAKTVADAVPHKSDAVSRIDGMDTVPLKLEALKLGFNSLPLDDNSCTERDRESLACEKDTLMLRDSSTELLSVTTPGD
jgi:hypothetical protein